MGYHEYKNITNPSELWGNIGVSGYILTFFQKNSGASTPLKSAVGPGDHFEGTF